MSEATQDAAAEIQLVVFQVAQEHYGAPIHTVREVVPAGTYRITRVPRGDAYLLGVTNLRGRVIPVVDLRRWFQLPARPATPATRIAVVEVDAVAVGLMVDGVTEVARIPAARVESPTHVLGGPGHEVITGVVQLGDRLVSILDMATLLVRDGRRRVEEGLHAPGI